MLHFKPIIEGQQLIVVTDHKPLTTAFRSLVPAKSDRQQRQLSFLTEHVSQVLHTKGSDNVVADTLSRAINSVEVDAIDIAAVAIQQNCDAEPRQLRMASHVWLRLDRVRKPQDPSKWLIGEKRWSN